jgi:protein-S-isoprenylcysteine O-methyltransferase Ste14
MRESEKSSLNGSFLNRVRDYIQAAGPIPEQRNLGAAAVLFTLIAGFGALAIGGAHNTGTQPSIVLWIISLFLGILGAGLGVFSLFGVIAYFMFIPSLSRASMVFSQAHASRMLHPFLFSLLLVLAGLGLYTRDEAVALIALFAFALYAIQTAFMATHTIREMGGDLGAPKKDLFLIIADLCLGGELAAYTTGAKPIPAWRLHTLPQDTWVVDVRTKPEFHWNRLKAAENYPWGKGLQEAAASRPKDRPVLVACFSGHRSPSSAAALKRMGFSEVYNLNWGIIYLIMTQRQGDPRDSFSLTRASRDPHRRGEDLTLITRSHVTLIFLILLLAPLISVYTSTEVSGPELIMAALLGLGGLAIAGASYLALGRNFRIYAAPRRSGSLVTSGIYSRTRHPMYTGVVLALAGYILLWGSHLCWPLWLGCAILYYIKGVKEDRILEDRFPGYTEYRKRTKRFIPYLI